MEKNVASGIPTIKYYDIILHTLATNECQELDSKFKEKAKQSLERMMTIYNKSIIDVQKYPQWHEMNFEMSTQFHFLSSKSSKMHMKLSRRRSN